MAKVILPSLNEDDYEIIIERASKHLRAHSGGYRGQILVPQNFLDFWVMKVTQAYLQEKLNETN